MIGIILLSLGILIFIIGVAIAALIGFIGALLAKDWKFAFITLVVGLVVVGILLMIIGF